MPVVKITFNFDGYFSNLREILAQEYYEYIVNNIPVDTGALRASIKSEVVGKSVIVSANTEYASYVEYGTSKQSPQPYMRPAENRTEEFIKKII